MMDWYRTVDHDTYAAYKHTGDLHGDGFPEVPSGSSAVPLAAFEEFDERRFYGWFRYRWTDAFWYSLVYVVVIFGGRHLMRSRPRFELRKPLIAWNLFLAAISICGAVRSNQEMYQVLSQHGFDHSLCAFTYTYPPFGFWVVLFIVSKVVEFGDTVFIVLRKQPLIFLHWYHHVMTLVYVWVTYVERPNCGRWFVTMNYTVHGFMYSYYACRAMRLRIPRQVNITITTMQILQMVVGLIVNIRIILIKRRGDYCRQSNFNIAFCLLMYFSYFLLFSWYFYNAYLRRGSSSSKAPVQKGKANGVHKHGVQNGVATNGTANGIKKHN